MPADPQLVKAAGTLATSAVKVYVPAVLAIGAVIIGLLLLQRKFFQLLHRPGKGACPRCGGLLVKRIGKYGPFTGCSNYPKCGYIKKAT